jgi:hypothetical protein
MTTAEPSGGNADQDGGIAENDSPLVDRSHNRDTLSSEAMTEMLRDLQDGLLRLGERVDELEAAQGHAASETRRLAVSVVEMGDALAKRVKSLELMEPVAPAPAAAPPPPLFISAVPRPPKRPADHPVSWSVGLGLALAGVLAAFWFLRSEISDQPLAQAASEQVMATPPAAIPVLAAPTVSAPHPAHTGAGPGHKAAARPRVAPATPAGPELYSPDVGSTTAPPRP